MEQIKNNKQSILRASIALIASAYFIYYASTPNDWHFIDGVNLVIHEAGHIIFMVFGNFMHVLGGSLLQVLFPLICTIYFFRRREYFSASLLLFWVGQNLINVSVYASDAIVMQLPLLGGDTAGHDWNNILSMLGVLVHTQAIGQAIYGLGLFAVLLAVFFSLLTSQKAAPAVLS